MEILELRDINPKTEYGNAVKVMVENGDHSDATVYGLISLLEQKQDEIEKIKMIAIHIMNDKQVEKFIGLINKK